MGTQPQHPLSTPQGKGTRAKLLLAPPQTHRTPLIYSTMIRVSSPNSLPSTLLVTETLPQVTMTLASAPAPIPQLSLPPFNARSTF